MFKVVLLILLFDPKSGQVHGVISPLPAYETKVECEAAKKEFFELNGNPPGLQQRAYCIVPTEYAL